MLTKGHRKKLNYYEIMFLGFDPDRCLTRKEGGKSKLNLLLGHEFNLLKDFLLLFLFPLELL